MRQAAHRLPFNLTTKWAEHCLTIRQKGGDPNLNHLCKWLQLRVMALKEAFLSGRQKPRHEEKPKPNVNPKDTKHTMLGLTKTEDKLPEKPVCPLCKGNHVFWKCAKYRRMQPEKKYDYVKSQKICFNCFSTEHMSSKCESAGRCQECETKHHPSLHKYFTKLKASATKDDAKDEEIKSTTDPDAKTVGLLRSSPKRVYLQIVQVRLHAWDGTFYDTYAVLDTCSESTMMRYDVAERLGLEKKTSKVNIATVKDDAEQMTMDVVNLKVSSRDGSYETEVNNVYLCPAGRFNMPSRPQLSEEESDAYTHLDGVPTEAVAAEEVSILIGADVPEAVLVKNWRRGNVGQPLAVETVFGWTLFGPSFGKCSTVRCSLQMTSTPIASALPSFWSDDERPPTRFVNLTMTAADEFLHQSVEKFWEQEHCGILPVRDLAMSIQDTEAEHTLDANTKLVDGHYEMPMLWDKTKVSLPNNYPVALKRYNFLERRLMANPEMAEKFKAVIDGYLAANPPFARKLTPEEAAVTSPRTWYLPMHPVTNPNKPGKVRVVNDAAATFEGTSLNSALITGPDLLNSLVGALLRLRIGRIAIAADVESMFHQVRVSNEDSDSLRFLWKNDLRKPGSPDVYKMLVHVFGAEDSPTCANYAIKRTARDNWSSFDGLTIETALKAFYVDDLLKSVSTVDNCNQGFQRVDRVAQAGGNEAHQISQ